MGQRAKSMGHSVKGEEQRAWRRGHRAEGRKHRV